MTIIPFSSSIFFFVVAAIIAISYLLKPFIKDKIRYEVFIFAISVLYWTICIRDHFIPIVLFILYEYAVLCLYFNKIKKRSPCFILMLLPLIMMKMNCYPTDLYFLGLSFASFRTVQLLYYAKAPKLIRFADFLLFFPIILSGPIDRYNRFEKDLESGYRNMNLEHVIFGWRYILLGILQKFFIAESINHFWLSKLSADSLDISQMAQNAVSYSLYLYFDFAGYSLMAIGVSAMLGILVPQNFKHPYLAKNPVEFWQRWHITLGEWLRDYIFMPVYKWLLRQSFFTDFPLFRQNIALFLTFQIMGAWHGLQSHYMVEGALFGLYSITHNSYLYYKRKYSLVTFAKLPIWLKTVFSRIVMLIFACLGLYAFSGRVPYLR